MILDKKLQLASNLDIGNAARPKTGTRISNLLPAEGLMDLGNGEQLFCCVTVTESFAPSTGVIIASPSPSFFSFRLHHTYDFFPESFEADGANDALTVMYAHRLQPTLAQTGYIPNGFGNFEAGKKFVFPISPITHKSTLVTGQAQVAPFTGIIAGPLPIAGLSEWTPGSALTYIYAVVEETGADGDSILLPDTGVPGVFGLGLPVTSNPVNQTASGRVDIDIVTISEPGAGPGFSDGYYYPVRAQVR